MNGKNGLLLFVAGMVVGGAVVIAARNRKVRELAVKAAGKGLQLKDEAAALVESLKEGVEDFFAEATASVEAEAAAEAPAAKTPARRPAPKKA